MGRIKYFQRVAEGGNLNGTDCWTAKLEAEIIEASDKAGFHLTGIAGAEPDPEDAPSLLNKERFTAWIEAGRAGEMEYLKRRDDKGEFLRSGLRVAIPWARSIVVCAFNYGSDEVQSIDKAPAGAGWIGRYAWSGKRQDDHGEADLIPTDYHAELLERLRLVEATLRERALCETRCYVDTGPIVERDFAAKAGVGWIGKNTCVINQELGSWLLLGVIVTSLRVDESSGFEFAPDRCGSCTRCIDACPTNALVAPREMDASRCIAYLTIEKKGTIDPELREGMGRQVFGCDICQDVCPWNQRNGVTRSRAHAAVTRGMEVRRELINPSLAWLAEMDSTEFKRRFKGSPLQRTGRKRLQRNVAIAMGNSGDPQFLSQLKQWAESEDEVLAESARWSAERIRQSGTVC